MIKRIINQCYVIPFPFGLVDETINAKFLFEVSFNLCNFYKQKIGISLFQLKLKSYIHDIGKNLYITHEHLLNNNKHEQITCKTEMNKFKYIRYLTFKTYIIIQIKTSPPPPC